MAKLFEFQEGYVISTMVSMDMSEILRALNFLELFVEVDGNSFEQCMSYRNCCIYYECSTLRLYSACLGSRGPTAANSFVQIQQ